MNNNLANLMLSKQNWPNLRLDPLPHLKVPVFEPPDLRPMFPVIDMVRQLNERWSRAFSGINDTFKPLMQVMERLAKEEARCKRLEEAGWMPHPESPWHLLDDEALSSDALNEAVEGYYRDNWPSVKSGIEEAISRLALDDEAKETFREALAAHEAGLYRCVARTLFPEIERVSRTELHNGAMDKIASQPKLQDAIGNLCPSDFARDGILGMRLYNKLVDHLYVSMPTAERVAVIAAEPVPNRHAAVHGYVPYNTLRHSMNALIIAEYLLHAITVVKEVEGHECEADQAEAA